MKNYCYVCSFIHEWIEFKGWLPNKSFDLVLTLDNIDIMLHNFVISTNHCHKNYNILCKK